MYDYAIGNQLLGIDPSIFSWLPPVKDFLIFECEFMKFRILSVGSF
jgi:hypothetical protein